MLNQLQTTVTGAGLSSAASALQAGSSRTAESFLVVRKASRCAVPLQARASSSAGSTGEGAGWLESSIAGKVASKVVSKVDNVLHYADGRHDNETVQYNGTAVVMKKLKALGLDAEADLEDDASEVEGKNVSVQLVSTVIDPSMFQFNPLLPIRVVPLSSRPRSINC